ncbi:MAG: hypothetical protein COV34_03585 [Candidatus Zambryskibacteria bacterium CG10_big_fil_rev_8_21_14_0_10_42_12]|uniref:TrbL/VirB6 plasmid conjugal transfer protein n=1 Tax=Candidatus Zambryskibacteria bacterium CG10_big_fil_rev_8_21_14_0_10_42_12 TaxID=1975115 RepID=A0A2H0QTM5_9BACT|nr:MAG: hypothetical protein COV34_03585 [Candidatus Zambryskibacteria bacterium CG10_big_fil_rev_8_21_14_0_10_42_12]
MVQSLFSARKFWLVVFVFSLIVGTTVLPHVTSNVAYAQDIGPGLPGGNDTPDPSDGDAPNLTDINNAAKNALDIWSGAIFDATTYIPAVLSELVVQLLSFGLWVSGVFFNFIVDETIVRAAQGALGSNSEHVLRPGIETAWKLIRDLINISFIFILLYQAIQLILGRANKAGKTIVRVAAVALLINFSIFITQVIVDASNIISIGFYDAFTTISNSTDPTDTVTERGYAGGISNAYMNALGIQSAWDGLTKTLEIGGQSSTFILSTNLLISLFLIVTMFVFTAAAIMLLVRYILIIFLAILSPLAFAGIILPGTQSYSKKWWETLTGQALFAPVFMIMTWVNLTLISALYSNPDRKDLGDFMESLVAGTSTQIGVDVLESLFNFSLIIGTAIASLILAKQIANRGGSAFGSLTNYIGGAALSGAGWAGRRSFGRFGQYVSDNDRLKEWSRTGKYGSKYLAQAGLWAGDRTAKSSFEPRSTKLGGIIFDGMGKAGGEGGFAKMAETKASAYEASIKRRAGATQTTRDALAKAEKDLAKKKTDLAKETKGTAAYFSAQQAVWDAEKNVVKQKKNVADETKRSERQMAAGLPATSWPGKVFIPNQKARELTAEKMTKIDDEKERDKETTRVTNEHISSILGDPIPATLRPEQITALRDVASKLQGKQIATMKTDLLKSKHLAPYITPQALDTLRKKDELSAPDRSAISGNIKSFIADTKTYPDLFTPEERDNAAKLDTYLGSTVGLTYWA